MGFYPIAGTVYYQIGAPLFRKSIIHMGNMTLTVETVNFSPANKYVSKVWFNEKLLSKKRISHFEIAKGGVLKFEMSHLPVRASQ